jgi:hypothetical protein
MTRRHWFRAAAILTLGLFANAGYGLVLAPTVSNNALPAIPVGTECDLTVKFTPARSGSTASTATSRNATLVFTDSNANVFTFGLAGTATSAIGHLTPGIISLYAGAALTGTDALDSGRLPEFPEEEAQ